jgi:GAF domain-containing protein
MGATYDGTVAAPDAALDDSAAALSAGFARMSGLLLSEETLASALELVTEVAVATIPGSSGSGVTLVRDERRRTTAATSPLVEQADALRYELDEGPCLTAIREHRMLRVDSMWQETRWPRWTARAAELGSGSTLSGPLMVRGDSIGAIKVYSGREGAFDPGAERLLGLFADQAAILLDNVASHAELQRLNEELRQALRTRDVIGQAKGILRARHGVDEAAAFAMLAAESQRANVKLREVAQRIADAADPGAGA